jgi:transcriptional regulator with XRE-family HTH domain
MSTVISDKLLEITEIPSGRMIAAMVQESLSDYVRRIKHTKNLTLNQIEKNSKGEISKGYVHDIIKEKVTNPSVAKLQALAKGLNVEANEIIAIARGKALDSESAFAARFSSLLESIAAAGRRRVAIRDLE